jgi:hypothetical protein
MGASSSTPAPRELVDACTALDATDITELTARFRAAALHGARLCPTPTHHQTSVASKIKKRWLE